MTLSQKGEETLLKRAGLLDECLKYRLQLVSHSFVLFEADNLLFQCRAGSFDLDLCLQSDWSVVLLITFCVFIKSATHKGANNFNIVVKPT